MARQHTVNTADVEITTGSKNLGTATIKAKNSSHIVQVLVNTMYANKEASSVREILSNAIDAHNMTNKKEVKVEIQIPTKTFPMLRIRDFGGGLSPEYMENEYLSLGHSEKRDRDDAVGFMGLGRFALFSLFKSYFVTSYYNGKKYPYSIHLDTKGDIELEIMDDDIEETNEPNGLEVFVLVDDEQRMKYFQQEILKLTFFCRDKVYITNLDEDELPHWYTAEPIYRFGNLCVYDKNKDRQLAQIFDLNQHETELIGIYDNIPYVLNKDFHTPNIMKTLESFQRQCLVAITLPIGSVERTASREGLERDKYNKTLTALNDIAAKSIKAIDKYKKELVKPVKSFQDLTKVTKDFFQYFNSKEVITWKSKKGTNHSINNNGFVSDIFRNNLKSFVIDNNNRLMSNDILITDWRSLSIDPEKDIFLNLDLEEREEVWRKRVKNYMLNSESVKRTFLFTQTSDSQKKFLEESKAIKISTLDKPVVAKKSKDKEVYCFHSISENYGGWNSYALSSMNLKVSDLKDAIVVYFTHKQRKLEGFPEELSGRAQLREFLRFIRTNAGTINVGNKNVTKVFLCGLSERNIKKVSKNKNFYSWDGFVENIGTLVPLTDQHFAHGKKVFFKDYNREGTLRLCQEVCSMKDIKDTWLKKEVTSLMTMKRQADNTETIQVAESVLKLYDEKYIEQMTTIEAKFDAIKDRLDAYPLISQFRYNLADYKEDIVLYLNTKYETIKNSKE